MIGFIFLIQISFFNLIDGFRIWIGCTLKGGRFLNFFPVRRDTCLHSLLARVVRGGPTRIGDKGLGERSRNFLSCERITKPRCSGRGPRSAEPFCLLFRCGWCAPNPQIGKSVLIVSFYGPNLGYKSRGSVGESLLRGWVQVLRPDPDRHAERERPRLRHFLQAFVALSHGHARNKERSVEWLGAS